MNTMTTEKQHVEKKVDVAEKDVHMHRQVDNTQRERENEKEIERKMEIDRDIRSRTLRRSFRSSISSMSRCLSSSCPARA